MKKLTLILAMVIYMVTANAAQIDHGTLSVNFAIWNNGNVRYPTEEQFQNNQLLPNAPLPQTGAMLQVSDEVANKMSPYTRDISKKFLLKQLAIINQREGSNMDYETFVRSLRNKTIKFSTAISLMGIKWSGPNWGEDGWVTHREGSYVMLCYTASSGNVYPTINTACFNNTDKETMLAVVNGTATVVGTNTTLGETKPGEKKSETTTTTTTTLIPTGTVLNQTFNITNTNTATGGSATVTNTSPVPSLGPGPGTVTQPIQVILPQNTMSAGQGYNYYQGNGQMYAYNGNSMMQYNNQSRAWNALDQGMYYTNQAVQGIFGLFRGNGGNGNCNYNYNYNTNTNTNTNTNNGPRPRQEPPVQGGGFVYHGAVQGNTNPPPVQGGGFVYHGARH